VKEECHETNLFKLLQLILSGKGLEKLLTKNVMVFRIMRALPSTKSDYAIDSLSSCCSVYIRKVVEEI
jgi:hypothetical protein